MSIAALGSTWLLSMATNALTGATGNKASSTSSTQTTGSANIGDAFQLSLSSAMMSAPPPPAAENGTLKTDIGNNQMAASGVGSELKAFLEKLLTGTATEDDFKSIEAKISALNTATGISAANSSTVTNTSEILRVSGVSRTLLNSATDAYNNQAYFLSARA